MRMDVDDLDAAILSHARERWLKAAVVASRAAPGNPSRPRFSEARRPSGADVDRAPRQDLRP
jgi:hypothetical protein